MLNAQQVWNRVSKLKAFAKLSEFDFRPVYYIQKFAPAAAAVTAWTQQDFPNGAIIIGVTANAFAAGLAIGGQSTNNRQLFGLDFQFSNTDAIAVAGPVMADVLLGGGDMNNFPVREIVIPPGSKINARVENYTTGPLNVHICYAALVYRTNA